MNDQIGERDDRRDEKRTDTTGDGRDGTGVDATAGGRTCSGLDGRDGGRTRREVSRATGLAALAAVGVTAGCVGTPDPSPERRRETVTASVAADRVDSLSVAADDAEATVEQTDGDEIEIEAEKFAVGDTPLSAVTLTATVTDGVLSVGVDVDRELKLGATGGGLSKLTVSVPEGVPLDRLAADDATVSVTDVGGGVTLAVDDADVTLTGVDGVSGTTADAVVTTETPVVLGDLTGEDALFELTAADLDGDTTVRVGEGDVTLRVTAALNAELVARSDSRVFVDNRIATDAADGEEVRAQIGDGGDRLRLLSEDGRIRVLPADAADE